MTNRRHEEDTPLDLNNIPEGSTRDNKGLNNNNNIRKRKSQGKDECSEKVYECRFCSIKFYKSQALGGHMNRHRQERKKESLNHARMLIYNHDNVIVQAPSHLLRSQPIIPPGTFHQASTIIGDQTQSFQHQVVNTQPIVFSTSMLSTAAEPSVPGQAPPAYIYRVQPNANEYIVGNALPVGATSPNYVPGPSDTYFTCIGAPVGLPDLNDNI